MANYAGKDSSFYAATGGVPVEGAWYSGQRYLGGQLLAPGQDQPGHDVSAEVIAQTNPNNVDYVNKQRQNAGLPPAPSQNNPAPAPTTGAPGGATPNISGLFGGSSANGGINLPSMYTDLSTKAGIPDLQKKADAIQAQIDTVTKEQGGQISNNNENPFLSEANRVGRESKINTDAQNQIDALTNEKNTILGQITTATTDINNQLGLATQQYNINDQQKQEALGQFNTLMSSGLLSNLSASDVATIAQSTGLPTDVINSAITASQKAGQSVQMVTTDHGVTLIDANTGNIIKDVTIPGVTGGGSGLTATQQKTQDATTNQNNAAQAIQAGATLREMVQNYGVPGGLTIDEIYQLYNMYSPYGQAQETLQQAKQGQFVS